MLVYTQARFSQARQLLFRPWQISMFKKQRNASFSTRSRRPHHHTCAKTRKVWHAQKRANCCGTDYKQLATSLSMKSTSGCARGTASQLHRRTCYKLGPQQVWYRVQVNKLPPGCQRQAMVVAWWNNSSIIQLVHRLDLIMYIITILGFDITLIFI